MIGVFIAGFSSILTGLNFIVTIHRLRAPGLTWYRLPLFIWSLYATSVILVLATPVLAITLVLIAVERVFGVGIFDPKIGGDPLLFQHLFWFYSHPAVYIMILPGMGVVNELISCFSRKEVFGYKFVAWASLAIAAVGFLVWGHHMFVSGQSLLASLVFSFMSFIVAVPSAIKVFNWTATLHKGSIRFDAPMLYALAFIGLFTIGGLTGLFLACLAYDVHATDTYFVVAHFHYIMVGGMVTAYFGGLHYWWPKITGRLYSEGWARAAAILIFFGFNLTFFPQFVLGAEGMPRRYHVYPPEFQVWNVLSSGGATILAVGLSAAAVLSRLFAVLRRARAGQSLECARAGMADAVAAARIQFCDPAGGDARSIPVFARLQSGAAECLTARLRAAIHRPPHIATRPPSSACGSSSRPKCCCSAACCSAISSIDMPIRRPSPRRAGTPTS